MKKHLIVAVAGLFLVMMVVGNAARPLSYAQEDEQPNHINDTQWTCPSEFAGEELAIYNWSLFIGEDTIPKFEELCDVEVTYDVYDTTEAILNQMRLGNPGYDVIFLSDFMVKLMAEEDRLIELDFDKLPNYANISEDFKGLEYDPENKYSAPYQWGTSGISYNVNKVDEAPTSWQDYFDHDGPVAWLDDYLTMIGIGLIMNGNPPNPTDSDMIFEAADYLLENSDNLRTIAVSDGPLLLETGEVDMIVGYSGEVYQLLASCECDDYAYVIPEEGSNYYVDTITIPEGARNVDLAHAFIDYMMDPHVAAANSNWIAYASPNQAALDQGLIWAEYLENPVIYLPEEVIENLYFLTQDVEFEVDMLDAWDEILFSLEE